MAQRILRLNWPMIEVRPRAGTEFFALLATYQSERAGDETDLDPALRRLLSQTGTPDLGHKPIVRPTVPVAVANFSPLLGWPGKALTLLDRQSQSL